MSGNETTRRIEALIAHAHMAGEVRGAGLELAQLADALPDLCTDTPTHRRILDHLIDRTEALVRTNAGNMRMGCAGKANERPEADNQT